MRSRPLFPALCGRMGRRETRDRRRSPPVSRFARPPLPPPFGPGHVPRGQKGGTGAADTPPAGRCRRGGQLAPLARVLCRGRKNAAASAGLPPVPHLSAGVPSPRERRPPPAPPQTPVTPPKNAVPRPEIFSVPHSATARPKGLPPQVVPTPSAALRKRAGQSKGQRARAREGEALTRKSLPCRGRLHRPRRPPPPQISRFGGCALPHSAAAPLSTAPLPKAL